MAQKARILGVFLVSAGLILTLTPVAKAQTYVYPINSYGTNYTTSYGSTGNCITLTNYLSIGSVDLFTNGQVSQLQQYLNRAGYLNGVSGNFDWNTYSAVVAFQNAHGIPATGTVGPLTRASINQASCGYGYSLPVPTPVTTVYPTYPTYPTNTWNSNCSNYSNYSYNNPSTYNSVVDRYQFPVYNYTYGNTTCGVTLNSAVASYNYSNTTITLTGSGFSSGVNNVHFNGSVYTSYSSNGTTLTFTVPNNYYSGNYDIYVVNANGMSSNTLSFPINSSSYNYNDGYNSNNSITLSAISGATSVQSGTTNTWNVNISNSTNNSYWNSNQSTSVVVNWGDSSNTTSQQVNLYGSQNLAFNHAYSNSGTYTIHVTATGANGAYAFQTLTVTVNGNYYNNGYANISYVSPNPVSIGSTLTITGSGFSSYGNTVHFGNGGSMNVSSYNGNTIYYTIPSRVSGCDLTSSGNGICAQWLSYVSSGSYPIYVTNNSGQTSNTVYVTVR